MPEFTKSFAMEPSSRSSGGFVTRRPIVLSMVKLLLFGIANTPLLRAAPTRLLPITFFAEDDADGAMPPDSPTLWIYLAVAIGLVLLGGAFAGLTIALMGQVLSGGPLSKHTLIDVG